MSPTTRTHMGTAALLAHTCRAEWARLWSVRSSWAFVAATGVAVLGIAALIGIDTAGDPTAIAPGTSAWTGTTPTMMFALFGVLALSVVTATADHGTGGIVPTLQWTPRRGVLLAARAGVIALTSTGVGVLLVTAATALVALLVPAASFGLGDSLRHVGALSIVLGTSSLLAIGLGLTMRSTAAAMVTVIALVLVLPPILAQLPYGWAVTLTSALPGTNVLFLLFGEGPTQDMSVSGSRTTLAQWAVGALLLGGWRLLRSDAG